MKENQKQTKGITLIALVITIIVLLILAGVSIAMLTGENGILTQAQRAAKETENAAQNEAAILDEYNEYLNNVTGGGSTGGGDTGEGTLGTVTGDETSNTTVEDSLGNKVVIPPGFIVQNPTDNVEDGIVIVDDDESRPTYGSEFVWIPVGTGIKKEDGSTFDIKLSRYIFDNSGIATDQGNNAIVSGSYNYQELNTGNGNTTAKENIESEETGFRKSAIENGGYYIGRYEARDGVTTSARGSSTSDTNQLVCTASNYVYNNVTQPQAASLSQGMYAENSNFTSDLMNSYAWDTAIDFLQKCDNRTDKTTPYSRQTTVNSTLATQGTNNLETKDQICNIFDMASNCYEWTTETYSIAYIPCVFRGGGYLNSYGYAASRNNTSTSYSYDLNAFRPLLYL